MKTKVFFLSLISTVLWLVGCAPNYYYKPFKNPEAQPLAKGIKKIACAHIRVDKRLKNSDLIASKFDALIASKLTSLGFSLVPSIKIKDIQDSVRKAVGGVYDPVSGELDSVKFSEARHILMQELSEKYQVDAILYSMITAINGELKSGNVYWWGASENIGPKSFLKDFLVTQSSNYSGHIPALTLFVQIYDKNNQKLYSSGGGIQLMSKLSEKFGSNELVPVPEEELCADEKRNEAAVNLALFGLSDKSE